MNEAYNNIMSRVSCKAYTDQVVDQETLEKIVEAGRMAPSGRNRQPLAFVIVKDRVLLNELSCLNAKILETTSDPFYGAPCCIVVLAKKDVSTYKFDGALAMENLMLAANALGVSSCWIHRAKEVFETEEGKALLKKWDLEGYEGIGHCILGYSKQKLVQNKPRTSIVLWE